MLKRAKAALAAALVLLAAGAARAQAPQQISVHNDWAAFAVDEQQGKACFIASAPQDKEPKNVQRGDVWVIVTHRPWKNVRSEVSVYAGYPYKEGSAVDLSIDGNKFELFTHDETAWAKTPADDKKLADAMRRGNRMVVTGESSRGTKTTDKYSLSGFTAASKAIDEACPQ